MKRILFIIALSSLIFSGCKKGETVITGQFIGLLDGQTPLYTVPISGTSYLGFSDTIKLDSTGKFELKLDISQPAFVTIWNLDPYKMYAKLLIEPGNSSHIQMDGENGVQISGANEKGQMLYTALPRPEVVDLELGKFFNLRGDTTSLISVHNKLNDLKQSELSKFKELLESKEISKSFFNLIQKDRDCYYTSMEARFSIIRIIVKSLSPGKEIEDNVLENLKKIYNQYPPNDESLLVSSFWYEYAEGYVRYYKQYTQADFSAQKSQDLTTSGMRSTYYIDESKKYLSGKALEFFRAAYMYSECFGRSFEKGLISLSEQFEKDYPQNEYSKYLKPYIDKIISYHQIIEQPFDPAMVFIDHYETINTLEEAIKPLLGKKIYIDVWATWCGPCIKEFAHNEALKKILAKNDIQQLYISTDRDENDQQWKNAIKFYHLTGTHIRANREFYSDLMKRFDRKAERPYIAIPWYILVDEKGNIIEEHAISPTQIVSGESLIKGS